MNPAHKAKIDVEDPQIVTFRRKGGKVGYRYQGVCPNDGTSLSKIAPASAANGAVQTGGAVPSATITVPAALAPVQVPLATAAAVSQQQPTLNSIELATIKKDDKKAQVDIPDELIEEIVKVIAKFLGGHPQVGNGLESLFLGLAPSLIPMIPGLINTIGNLFTGRGISFPSNQQMGGAIVFPTNQPIGGAITFPSNRPLVGAGAAGPYLLNETVMSGAGIRNPIRDLEVIANKVLNK